MFFSQVRLSMDKLFFKTYVADPTFQVLQWGGGGAEFHFVSKFIKNIIE